MCYPLFKTPLFKLSYKWWRMSSPIWNKIPFFHINLVQDLSPSSDYLQDI